MRKEASGKGAKNDSSKQYTTKKKRKRKMTVA
jgi:hypothetical protein